MRFQAAFIAVAVLTASMVIANDNLDDSKASSKIELLGGNVTRDETLPGRPVIGVDFRGSKRFSDKFTHVLLIFGMFCSKIDELTGRQFLAQGDAAISPHEGPGQTLLI